ncbi:MAG: hypothetical protein GKR89_07610 [Candidatus Latescibacteria bacterium]|nr:hypothetical protein [Candidatus Latescibacterota bacterium]
MVQLNQVNTTDLVDAIGLGCRAMGRAFNRDDADMPYGGAQVRPTAYLGGSMEGHMPGRHLNALLAAEEALGLELDDGLVDKHARAAFFSYRRAPLPLQRIGQHKSGKGEPVELLEHNLREGFHALYALAAFRGSERAVELAAASIDLLFEYWVPNQQWDRQRLEGDTPVRLTPAQTFIQGPARAIGPLVKLYRVTGHRPALELAEVLKDKAVREVFLADGSFANQRFGVHVHSTTCVLSSLAQLAECTGDSALMDRVSAFYNNGLWDLRDQIGWSIEVSDLPARCRRGEANNTGDIIETALILGRWGRAEYYADAERMLRSHLLPSQLRDISFIEEPDNPDGIDGKRDVAQRLQGGFGFPAPYGHEPLGIWQSNKPRIGFNIDIVGGSVGSLVAAYKAVVRRDGDGHWVDMLFDCCNDDIEVQSPYTHGRLAVKIKRPGELHVRVPSWIDGAAIKVEGACPPTLSDGYAVLEEPAVGAWIGFVFELPVHETVLTWRDSAIRARLRGDEVVAMDNFGTDLTFFESFD